LLYNAYKSLINRYKEHPSLLAWCLGNELEMPYSFTTTPFYKSYNKILSMIQQDDPHHPVTTTIINVRRRSIINIQLRIPALDFISINIYNSLKTIQDDLNKIKLIWRGPYLIAEWAPIGGWEAPLTAWQAPIENTSTEKAKLYYKFFTKFMPTKSPRYLGSLAFYWGSRHEYTYTWYSIFNDNGSPTEIQEVLHDCWSDTLTPHQSPKLTKISIDSLEARDNIIISQGSIHKATILVEPMKFDTLQFSWQILKEDWLSWGQTWYNLKAPPAEIGLINDSARQSTFFTAPTKQGPYRVFVTVNNSRGFTATANIPIYVVEK